MKLSNKSLSLIFYTSTALSASAGAGIALAYAGDATVSLLSGSSEEMMQECKDRAPDHPELWVGCHYERVRGVAGARHAHDVTRQVSFPALALTAPVAAAAFAMRRARRKEPSL